MAFISGFEVYSLKVGQYKILKLKDKRKKKGIKIEFSVPMRKYQYG